MLDYMTLYNAYFYVYLNDDAITANIFSNNIYPELIDLPPPHEDFWVYTTEVPKYHSSAILIETIDNVNEGGGVVYKAGESIKLMAGFYADEGSAVLAAIDESLGLIPYYTKTNIDPCNGGTFEPISANYIASNFPSAERKKQFEDDRQQIKSEALLHNKTDYKFKESVVNIETQNSLQPFKTFPNPTHDLFKVILPIDEKVISLQIFDYMGHVVYSGKDLCQPYFEFDLSEFDSGIYVVNIKTHFNDKRLKVFKY